MAKLTRWGIDIHMGALFGFINQVIVSLMSLAICGLVITGYMLWFKSHGWKFKNTLVKEFIKLKMKERLFIFIFLLPVIFFAPLVLVSLLLLILLEEFLSKKLNQ